MTSPLSLTSQRCLSVILSLLACLLLSITAQAQNEVTGAFEGRVTDRRNGSPVAGASVRIKNVRKGTQRILTTDSDGRFYQGLLEPDVYEITVEKLPEFTTQTIRQTIFTNKSNESVPLPVVLEPAIAVAQPTPTPTMTPEPGVTPTPAPTPMTPDDVATRVAEDTGTTFLYRTDGRRGGIFTDKEVSTLPLGGVTLTRTFDELALLLPGVAPPPPTQGSVAGPGVGAGVGSAGQFSVNGLRSRANNFTVDGSDNNDEDIGVRRQGFFSLVPQPIESIQEYQVITLLAPAQYGRNFGAQVNAVSKSGGNRVHGTVFGFLNTSETNSRDFFDTTLGNAVTPLRVGNQAVLLNGNQITTRNGSGGEEPFRFGQGGFVVGGPVKKDKAFFFVSFERQYLEAKKEASFAVPTVAQRGFLGTGATGIFTTPLFDVNGVRNVGDPDFYFPTTFDADAIFSLFPFPNNPTGVYGANTLTQQLPASARGTVASGKFDINDFGFAGKRHSFTLRYNFTQDRRQIPVTGEAIFSSLEPMVRTQNIATFLNTELSGSVFNQLRLSYGRTRLKFKELRDQTFLTPSGLLPNEPFLLNAPFTSNITLPNAFGVANTGPVLFSGGGTAENILGPVGQIKIAGFSPVGVDVFNFPQRRINNTYQVADTVNVRSGRHNIAFGTDLRRVELNSALPRNSRPLITFNGAPRLLFDITGPANNRMFSNFRLSNNFIPGIDLAAASASSGFVQTLANDDAGINLRYYQLYFFGQDEWQIRPNFTLTYGLRYEYSTVPEEASGKIERTFNSNLLNLVPGLGRFIDGRTGIYESDRNNFAPRVGFAYSPTNSTVIRAGYGLFYDQILGAVVSQSRNVFPTFLTADFAGGGFGSQFGRLGLLNPNIFAQPGTLNRLNLNMSTLTQRIQAIGAFSGNGAGAFGATLPARNLETPLAHHYSVSFEQQLGRNLVASAAYVGTQGRNLLRFTTPNLGPNGFTLPVGIDASSLTPDLFGFALPPGTRVSSTGFLTGGRPTAGVGAVTIFETTADSRYDALQVQLRGRYRLLGSTQFQVNYTFSRAEDDVSDVFDLAGASALPQNSLTFAGERGAANFDARHRVSYNYVTDLPNPGPDRHPIIRGLFGGIQLAGTGMFQTGQPFTVNSINDVNLDGNLTDRLNTTTGITVTGDRRQPLRLTNTSRAFLASLLAQPGQDGSVGRNTFRSGNVWVSNFAFIKKFTISEQQSLHFRIDVFNVFNRANFGIPVRYLESPGFGQATDTVTPGRRIQFALKFAF